MGKRNLGLIVVLVVLLLSMAISYYGGYRDGYREGRFDEHEATNQMLREMKAKIVYEGKDSE